jgi:hypothetical protein
MYFCSHPTLREKYMQPMRRLSGFRHWANIDIRFSGYKTKQSEVRQDER